jgi:hypothetical protein
MRLVRSVVPIELRARTIGYCPIPVSPPDAHRLSREAMYLLKVRRDLAPNVLGTVRVNARLGKRNLFESQNRFPPHTIAVQVQTIAKKVKITCRASTCQCRFANPPNLLAAGPRASRPPYNPHSTFNNQFIPTSCSFSAFSSAFSGRCWLASAKVRRIFFSEMILFVTIDCA